MIGQVVSERPDIRCGAKKEVSGQTEARNPEVVHYKGVCRH